MGKDLNVAHWPLSEGTVISLPLQIKGYEQRVYVYLHVL